MISIMSQTLLDASSVNLWRMNWESKDNFKRWKYKSFCNFSVHSSIFLTSYSIQGCEGVEPIQTFKRQEAGHTLDKSPANAERRTTVHTHIHTYGQFRQAS